MKFHLKRSGSQYRFTIVARNGRILAHSELYTSRGKALRAVKVIMDGAYWARIVG